MARATLKIPTGADTFQAALEGLVRVNQLLMVKTPIPPLYNGKVRYQREAEETWRTAQEVARSGFGDCEDLAAYRVAELRNKNIDPKASVGVRKSSCGFHAVVNRGDGTTEDPSAKLGMNGPDDMPPPQYKTRYDVNLKTGVIDVVQDVDYDNDTMGHLDEIGNERCRLGADPLKTVDVTWEIERSPSGGWRGVVRVPLTSGRALFFAGPSQTDKAKAAPSAISTASKILDNKYANALIPPQAKMALAIARSATARSIAKKLFG